MPTVYIYCGVSGAGKSTIVANRHRGSFVVSTDKFFKEASSWIDEAGAGETTNLGELWTRIEAEISASERLILYVEPEDFPLKGALIEVGMAIAHRIPIHVVAPGVVLEPRSMRPIGSWVRHPLVTFADTMEEALEGATFSL